jgi:GT2 family glycosyltransferase
LLQMPQAASPVVFVCIVNWNKKKETLDCLRSVLAQDYANLRVVVVDNGSTDDSVAAFRDLGRAIDLIEHQENSGFTGGSNAGLRYARDRGADYVWLLNNDSECTPEILSLLIDYAESRPKVGMVSPVIADRHSRVDNFTIGRIDLATGQVYYAANSQDAKAMQERYPQDILLKGTALLLKRQLIESIGLFDDRFFAYCEDNDYSMRCAAAGFRAECVFSARIYHDEGSPGDHWRPPHAFYYATRNGFLFWRKHARFPRAWKYARWHACSTFRLLARGGYERTRTEAFADGLWSGVRGTTGRWEPSCASHHMPLLLRRMFVANPALSLALMEANNLRAIWRAIRSPYRKACHIGTAGQSGE